MKWRLNNSFVFKLLIPCIKNIRCHRFGTVYLKGMIKNIINSLTLNPFKTGKIIFYYARDPDTETIW
jgi:hypothetical protein